MNIKNMWFGGGERKVRLYTHKNYKKTTHETYSHLQNVQNFPIKI